MNRIIEDFSYLRKTNCKGVYLDNAATTLCPDEVIDYMSEMQKYNFVNINRGSYKLAEETFEKYELAKKKILHFLEQKTIICLYKRQEQRKLLILLRDVS